MRRYVAAGRWILDDPDSPKSARKRTARQALRLGKRRAYERGRQTDDLLFLVTLSIRTVHGASPKRDQSHAMLVIFAIPNHRDSKGNPTWLGSFNKRIV